MPQANINSQATRYTSPASNMPTTTTDARNSNPTPPRHSANNLTPRHDRLNNPPDPGAPRIPSHAAIMYRWLPLLLLALPLLALALAAEDYYGLLGLERDADDRQIKKAYRRLSKKYHPDKNPDDDSAHHRFVQVSEAYDVLIDPDLRAVYNRHGHEGVKRHQQTGGGGGGAQPHDPFDLFSRFFGGGGHFRSGQRRGPDMEVKIELPLRDFYTGATHEITVEKQTICERCEGSGSADGHRDPCARCRGQGVVLQKHMLAPGIFQQMQMQCDACAGSGSTVRHACPACAGARVVRAAESYELVVEPGWPRAAPVTFENEAGESPDWVAGHLVVQVHERTPALPDPAATDPPAARRRRLLPPPRPGPLLARGAESARGVDGRVDARADAPGRA